MLCAQAKAIQCGVISAEIVNSVRSRELQINIFYFEYTVVLVSETECWFISIPKLGRIKHIYIYINWCVLDLVWGWELLCVSLIEEGQEITSWALAEKGFFCCGNFFFHCFALSGNYFWATACFYVLFNFSQHVLGFAGTSIVVIPSQALFSHVRDS